MEHPWGAKWKGSDANAEEFTLAQGGGALPLPQVYGLVWLAWDRVVYPALFLERITATFAEYLGMLADTAPSQTALVEVRGAQTVGFFKAS